MREYEGHLEGGGAFWGSDKLWVREDRVEAWVTSGGECTREAPAQPRLATSLSPVLPISAVAELAFVVGATTSRYPSRYERYAKPVFDRCAGLVLGILAVPLFLLLAAAIRIKLGSGVIYKQCRVGRHGVPFTMYKFRTMAPDRRTAAVPYVGPERRVCHKRDDDPRHTRFGVLLRQSSLDELPQLWNVIRGEMSLVGPRPELPHVVARYEPWQHERHQVKPGITGFWQVSGRAGGLAYEGVELDIDYLRSLSFVTDLVVLLRTVPATVGRTGR